MNLLSLPMRLLPEALNPKYLLRHRLIGHKPTLLSLYILHFHNIPFLLPLPVMFVRREEICEGKPNYHVLHWEWSRESLELSIHMTVCTKCHKCTFCLPTYQINKKHLSYCTIALFPVLNNSVYFQVLNPRLVCNLRLLDILWKNVILWSITI